MVYALAKLRTPEPDGTQFPIIECWNSKSRKRFAQQTRGMPDAAREIIYSLQPCHAPESAVRDRLLWRLNALSNLDKHRRIPVHSAGITFHFPSVPRSVRDQLEFGPGDSFSVPLALKGQMGLAPEVTFDVSFGDFSGDPERDLRCDLDGIERIYEFVSDNLIPRFTRFFR
jgi:hypothetical protein